jgi:hypothetical protein
MYRYIGFDDSGFSRKTVQKLWYMVYMYILDVRHERSYICGVVGLEKSDLGQISIDCELVGFHCNGVTWVYLPATRYQTGS